MKVFSGGPDLKSLRREIEVVSALPPHENIVRLYGVEEDVSFFSAAVYIRNSSQAMSGISKIDSWSAWVHASRCTLRN